jgi:8-oxo-dGTP diphosphatase
MEETIKQEAVNFLRGNEIYNLSIIGFIEGNSLERIIRVGNSFLVQGTGEEKWTYFYGDNEDEFSELAKSLRQGDQYFGALDDKMVPVLKGKREIEWHIKALQFHFPDDVKIPGNKVETKRLTTTDSDYIISQSVYKNILTVEYLNERIKKSVSAGICVDGKLVAWGLTHDDGSLGTMHVLEDYRRRGYAKEISISLINQCSAIGKIPFLQCENKNIPAQNLVKSIGYVQDRNVSWLKLK